MKKLIVAVLTFALLATPAHAWYRGGYGGWGYRPYAAYGYGYPGWGYGGWGYNNYGAAMGVAAGAAILGGVLGAAAASQQPYYGAQCPVYDTWGNFIGYQYC